MGNVPVRTSAISCQQWVLQQPQHPLPSNPIPIHLRWTQVKS